MKIHTKITSIAGLAGSGLIALSSLLSAGVYKGKYGEPFSFLNHFISELGEVGVSEWASVFNLGLIVGGLCLTLFMLGLASHLGGWFGVVFGMISFVTGVSGTLVGIFPMNNLAPHIQIALTFFYSGMFATILFSTYVLFSRQDKFRKTIAIPGTLTAVCFFSFLFLTDPAVPEGQWHDMAEIFANRPDYWQTAVFEWAVLVTVLAFVVVVSVTLLRQENASKR